MGEITDAKDYLGLNEFSKDRNLWRALIAEFLGTLVLVFVGCGSCLGGWSDGYAATIVQIAFAFGIAVATMVQIYWAGPISGRVLAAVIYSVILRAPKRSSTPVMQDSAELSPFISVK